MHSNRIFKYTGLLISIPFVNIELTVGNPGDWIIRAMPTGCRVFSSHSVVDICYETIVIHSFTGIANNDICEK